MRAKYIEDLCNGRSPNFEGGANDVELDLAEVLESTDCSDLHFSKSSGCFKKSKSTPRALRGGNFEVSCTASEIKSYKKWAKDCGFPTLSAFVKAAIKAFMNIDVSAVGLIRTQLEEEYKAKLYCISEINQIGNNLNQLSRNVNVAHFNGEAENWVEIHEELIKIYMLEHLLLAKITELEIGGSYDCK